MKNKPTGGSGRTKRNVHVTKSGKSIKINRSLVARLVASKDAKQQRRAERLAALPKSRFKRFLYHFQPRRMYKYWFSRDGGIMALKITGVGLIAGFLLLIGLFAYFRKDLPNLKDISGTNIGGSIRYYDKTGQTLLWEDYDAVKRIPVNEGDISPFLKQATVAVEDKDFYKHGGFDVRGILRAGVNNAVGSSGTQGGSTITQQLVKLTQDWTKDRTYTRKVKELILAVELERTYSKNEILSGYLNAAPYGNVEYGVEAASRDYFQKSAKDLTLEESAFLAAIPKSPSFYSPYGAYYDSKSLVEREHYVLDLMEQQHMISKEQLTAAKKVDILATVHEPTAKYTGIKAPYFVLSAKKELEQKYGADTVNRGGWKVTTTLDMGLQNTAEDLVNKNLASISKYGADTEAMVGEDVQTGQIVSLVGGVDFTNADHGQNNFASGILLPPGSSFKPYDYATLINNNTNVGAGSVLYDTQGALPGYPCTNKTPLSKNGGNCLQDYDFIYPGPLTLRYALGGSRNVPAVKAMLSSVPNDTSNGRVDSVNKVISTATAMMANPNVSGNAYNCYDDEALTKPTQCYGAAAIGDGAFLHLDDHVNGLGTLARMGNAIPRTYILKITDASNKTVSQFKQPKGTQVLKPDTAYIVNDMASDPNASYLPGSCTVDNCTKLANGGYKFQRFNGWKFAVKTGTTNDGYDGLMTSWSSKYAVVSWVGNHTRHVTLRTSMEILTEPLTRGWMEAAHTNLKSENWTAPAGIKSLPAFVVRNHIHFGDIEPSPTNDLFPSWYTAKTGATANQTMDKVSNKIATDCTPDLAKDTTTNANASSWNIDIFAGGTLSGGTATNSTAKDDVHKCEDVKPSVDISANGDGSITATVHQGTNALNSDKFKGTVNFISNGQVLQSFGVTNDGDSVTLPASAINGSQTISAQVIDSVLYSGTSATSITVSASPAASITLNATHTIAGVTTFSWSGGTETVTVHNASTNAVLCSGTSSCTKSGVSTGTSVVAKDSGSPVVSSNTVTVSGNP